jgi:hypothetical protein
MFDPRQTQKDLSSSLCVQTGSDRPDDGGSKHLWNVGQLQRHYTALHSKRL